MLYTAYPPETYPRDQQHYWLPKLQLSIVEEEETGAGVDTAAAAADVPAGGAGALLVADSAVKFAPVEEKASGAIPPAPSPLLLQCLMWSVYASVSSNNSKNLKNRPAIARQTLPVPAKTPPRTSPVALKVA